MIKNLLLFLLLASSSVNSFSQGCAVDTSNYDLFSPPSEELPCVIRNTPYDLVLQLFCPPAIAGITIDSIRVTAFHGLPNGLIKTSTPTRGTMYPLGRMCINVSGTTTDTVGYYPILYDGTAYTSAGAAPFWYLRANVAGALPEYALTVIDSGEVCNGTATGIKKYNRDLIGAFTVYPNPNKGVFQFRLNNMESTDGEIKVSDVTGRILFLRKTPATSFYETAIDLNQYAKGIYFVEYRTINGAATKKITME